MTSPSAAGSIDIAATPKTVYALITDLPTLTSLASETEAMTWRSGSSATPGAVFSGNNRNGWRRWKTTCTVTDAEPGHKFGFEVRHTVVKIARWQYDIQERDAGCRVTESTWDRRPGWFKVPAELATGMRNRSEVNAQHIRETLLRLKAKAESG
ncbi:MAG TPA: SRPBCC family protein [Jatrophihabitantaceae bacterium]|jgi:hypothetical protein|nr:SRPBCC family protein [Jatrophihabitantaceae bacterium]